MGGGYRGAALPVQGLGRARLLEEFLALRKHPGGGGELLRRHRDEAVPARAHAPPEAALRRRLLKQLLPAEAEGVWLRSEHG